jgi:DNA-binding transcriptional MerR regulator
LAKSAEAFRTISEAADELGLPQHVLRYWETRFSFIRPMKRAGGRRFYRPADVAVLGAVRDLLHAQGYTIKGVQKLYLETGLKHLTQLAEAPVGVADRAQGESAQASESVSLRAALTSLEAAKCRLDRLLNKRRV